MHVTGLTAGELNRRMGANNELCARLRSICTYPEMRSEVQLASLLHIRGLWSGRREDREHAVTSLFEYEALGTSDAAGWSLFLRGERFIVFDAITKLRFTIDLPPGVVAFLTST